MNYPVIIALVVLISYWKAIIWGGYVIDDQEIAILTEPIPKNRFHRLYLQIQGKRYFDPQEEYLINIIIHLVNAELVYFAFGQNKISFLTALLFAVNPVGTQASTWLSGKGYSISTMFILLAWWLFPALCLLCPLFSANAFLVPLLFIKKQWLWLLLFPILLKLAKPELLVLKERHSHATKKGKTLDWKKGIIVMKCLGYYFMLILIPRRLGMYHSFLYCYTLSEKDNKKWEKPDGYFWLGCLIIYILITNMIWNYNPAIFGLFWFVVLIIQWCNFVSLNQTITERYTYAAMIGLMYLLANSIMFIPESYRMNVFIAIFIAYEVRLQFTLPAYYDLERFIDFNRWNFPDLYVVWTWKGQIEKRRKSFFTALEYWFRGWKMRPEDFRINNNIAVMLTDLGRFTDAEEFLNNAEKHSIPEQKIIVGQFLAHERERIAKGREILKSKEKRSKIVIPGVK